MDMELLSESSIRKGGQNQAYLRGYSLPQTTVMTTPGAVEMAPYGAKQTEYAPAAATYGQQPVYVTIVTSPYEPVPQNHGDLIYKH